MALALVSDALRRREREQATEQAAAAAADAEKTAVTQMLQTLGEELAGLRAQMAAVRAMQADFNETIAAAQRQASQLAEQHVRDLREANEQLLAEREARVQAQAKPPEVQIIREPAPLPPTAPSPSLPAWVPAPVPPDPPRTWNMRVMERDPNGAIAHVRWSPQVD
jgi:hypothetical protein